MTVLSFATGSSLKFDIAVKIFGMAGIDLMQEPVEIDEIQSTDGNYIVRDKAAKAFSALGKPVVVNDDLWAFPGLGGFPGAYMKDVAQWFTADDFLRLTAGLQDKRVILSQFIAYQDRNTQQIFRFDFTGQILPEKRGLSGSSLQKVITMPGDNGKSISEMYDGNHDITTREVADGWRAFITWHKEYTA